MGLGSKHHIRSLKKCRSSPSSQTCRKHVYYSKGIKIKGCDDKLKDPRNGSMTRKMLTRNKRGKIVSRKKSKQGSKAYFRRDSKLRRWNEIIARQLGRHDTFEPLTDPPYVDFTPLDDDPPYIPFVVEPRRTTRPPKPIPPGGQHYKGVRKSLNTVRPCKPTTNPN